jgi:predicted dehydrogenase
MAFKKGAIGQLLYNDATFASDLPHEGIFSWGQSWEIDGTIGRAGEWQEHPGSIRIHGTKGALRVFHYPSKLFYFSPGEAREVQVGEASMPGNFGLQMEAFLNSLVDEQEPEATGIDGLKALQTLLAVYESYESKAVVSLGE